MALTGRIVASVYNYNGNDLPQAGLSGIANSFPSANAFFYPTPAGTTANGVTMNSVIQLLPTGLNVNGAKYLTDSTPAQITSAGS